MNEGMELSAFITETIMSVVKGVEEAKKQTAALAANAVVNPVLESAVHSDPEKIQFDIAVAVAETSGASGKAGIQLKVPLLSAAVGADGKTEKQSTNTSRISFSVPLAMPSTAKSQYRESSQGNRSGYDPFDN